MPNRKSEQNDSGAKALELGASACAINGCIDSTAGIGLAREQAVPTMPFKPLGASLCETSRNRTFLNRHSGPGFGLFRALAILSTIATATFRRTERAVQILLKTTPETKNRKTRNQPSFLQFRGDFAMCVDID